MANQNSIADLSTTVANNLNWRGQSIQGTATVSTIDDMLKRLSAMLKAEYDSIGGTATVSGTDTYTVTITEDWAALASGLFLAIKVANANTGASTLNVTVPTAVALGAKAIRRQGDSALQANDMVANGIYLLRYSSSYNSSAGAWVLLNPAVNTSSFQASDADLTAIAATGVSITSGMLYGLTLSNNGIDPTNDIDIAAGVAMDATNAKYLSRASSITKQLDAAWAVGTNAGGLDTGTIANTTYHVWLIMRSDTGVVDVLFSTSATAPTMPTNYDYKRRIGSIVRSSAAIKAFHQDGDRFTWDVAVVDVDASNPGTSAVTRTLTLPTGVVVTADIVVAGYDGTTGTVGMWVSPLDATDQAPQSINTAALTGFNNVFVPTNNTAAQWKGSRMLVKTNTSAQIRTRSSASGASDHIGITTIGWIDVRGRLA